MIVGKRQVSVGAVRCRSGGGVAHQERTRVERALVVARHWDPSSAGSSWGALCARPTCGQQCLVEEDDNDGEESEEGRDRIVPRLVIRRDLTEHEACGKF